MHIQNVHSIFFSPTGTSKAVVHAVTRGTGYTEGRRLNLSTGISAQAIQFTGENLVIVGVPVYAGRLPALAVERLKSFTGNNAPVVPIVVYGNRAYEDALLELSDLCTAQGFQTIAAAAFIGEHSFSSAELPIAPARPDDIDLQCAKQFGRQISELLGCCESVSQLKTPDIPGNRPYKPAMQPTGAATKIDHQVCTHCGECVELCPPHTISMTDAGPVTDADHCIWCMACLRNCPVDARQIALPKIHATAERLHGSCKQRQETEIFLASC